jgi:cysteine desulfurase
MCFPSVRCPDDALQIDARLRHLVERRELAQLCDLRRDELDDVIDLVANKVKKLRELSPLYEMAQAGIDLKSIIWAAH